MPFKNGAFYIAKKLEMPIVPVVISNLRNRIKFNSWNNGYVLIKVLPIITVEDIKNKKISELAKYCFNIINKNNIF